MAKQPEGSDFLDAGGCCVNPEYQQGKAAATELAAWLRNSCVQLFNGKLKWLLLPIFTQPLPLLCGRKNSREGINSKEKNKGLLQILQGPDQRSLVSAPSALPAC